VKALNVENKAVQPRQSGGGDSLRPLGQGSSAKGDGEREKVSGLGRPRTGEAFDRAIESSIYPAGTRGVKNGHSGRGGGLHNQTAAGGDSATWGVCSTAIRDFEGGTSRKNGCRTGQRQSEFVQARLGDGGRMTARNRDRKECLTHEEG